MAPLYLVDGFNLLHAAVLAGRSRPGWWGADRQRQVVELSERFGAGEVVVVFDERGSERATRSGRVDVRFAPDADEYIVSLCASLRSSRSVVVVSADRSLCDRAVYRGAARLSPWRFAAQCREGAGA
jgi:predicted RNA-binding protein with PIN domain